MDGDRSLSHGLLGHWPGNRSPDGIVRDRSPEGNHGNYGIDARWIWFTNPRAVRHVGREDRTYVSYLGGSTGRDLVIAAYDHGDRAFATTVLETGFSADDHTNPSVYVRTDGHVLVFWTGHNGDAIYHTISSDPESVDSFAPVRTIDGESVTYPNPIAAPGDRDELYLFYRDRIYTRDATDDKYGYVGDGNLYYRASKDGGRTWGKRTRLVTPPEGHYSMYFVLARGSDGIHFFFTDAERGGDAPKWNVMYAQFEEGAFHAADGQRIAGPSDLPITKSDLEIVYDSAADGNHYAWIWDAAVDDDGQPVAAYATFPSTLSHEYRYARWDGDRWQDSHLAEAGRYVARRPVELHYSGGVSLDRDDPSVVYGCVERDGNCSLRRFETDTGGETWSETAVAERSPGWDIRPVVPRNASAETPVLWLTGSYGHIDESQTVLRGLPSDQLSGEVLEAEGHQGVDLGFDQYDATAFADGVCVTAWIEPRDVATPGVVANFGGMITLGTALDGGPGIAFSVTGPGGETTVSWPEARPGDRVHVAGRWDGDDRITLAVDGDVVDSARFDGPLDADCERASWTLLKGEYLLDRGYDGTAADIRLYDRSLSDDELRTLADCSA